MDTGHAEKWERLTEFVVETMHTKRVPGVALGILHAGEMTTAGFGVTNVDHPLPITDETLFQIGSITKTFTGTVIMRLAEMGKLDLDVAVRAYVPGFKVADETASSQATVRHLLTHLGGWAGDFFHDTGAGDDALSRYVADMADLPQLAPVGTLWSYNNAGFSLAGRVIEMVTGTSYDEALKELLLDPLGIQHALLRPGDVMTHRFAVGHDVTEAGAQVARPWPLPRAVYPAGGIVCHVKDLLRYAHFHMGDGRAEDGTRLLAPDSIAQMQSPQVCVWGSETWGLTWALDDTTGTRQVMHGGVTKGQISLLMLVPGHDFAIAVLTNADRGGDVTRAVSRRALKAYLGVEIADPTPIEASEEILAPYVGRYQRPFADIELGILGGRLVGQTTYKGSFPTEDAPPPPAPPPMSLAPIEKDRLIVLDGPSKDERFDVLRKPDGTIGWLRAGLRLHVREA